MEIYVAAYGERYSDSDPFWIVGAYSTADSAKDACEADAARSLDLEDAPAIKWRAADMAGSAYWTDAAPHGYRINRVTVDEGATATVGAAERETGQ